MTDAVIEEHAERAKASISHRLLLGMIIGFSAVIAAVGLAVTLMAVQTDRQTADTSFKLAQISVAKFEAQLERQLREHLHQANLRASIKNGELEHFHEDAGPTTPSNGNIDPQEIIISDGASQFNWISGGTKFSPQDLLPLNLRRSLINRLDARDVTRKPVVLTYTMYEGELWLLGMTQITSPKETIINSEDTTLFLVFGVHVSDQIHALVPKAYLWLDEASGIPKGHVSFLLQGIDGNTLARVVWPTSHIGWASLTRALPVIILALVFIGFLVLFLFKSIRDYIFQLERGLRSAQKASKVKSHFLANISHELRTPMNAVIGLVSLLKRSKLDDDQKEMIEVIWESANAQMALLNDLTDISKIEANTLTLNCAPFEPVREIRSIVGLFKQQAHEKGIDLNFTLPDGSHPLAIGDSKAFRQVATNLVSNAVKFTDHGTVHVIVNLNCVAEVGMEFEMIVTDTGSGIPDLQQAEIFKRFHRVEANLANSKDGSGLGLAICKALTDLMGGRIDLQSQLGKGSIFTLTIPFDNQTMEQAA